MLIPCYQGMRSSHTQPGIHATLALSDCGIVRRPSIETIINIRTARLPEPCCNQLGCPDTMATSVFCAKVPKYLIDRGMERSKRVDKIGVYSGFCRPSSYTDTLDYLDRTNIPLLQGFRMAYRKTNSRMT